MEASFCGMLKKAFNVFPELQINVVHDTKVFIKPKVTGVMVGLSMPYRLPPFPFLWFLHIRSTNITVIMTRRQNDPITALIMTSTEKNRIEIYFL